MLQFSVGQVTTLQAPFLTELREKVVEHWLLELRAVGARATPAGREAVLARLEAMSRESPELTMQELVMLGDLLLLAEADSR